MRLLCGGVLAFMTVSLSSALRTLTSAPPNCSQQGLRCAVSFSNCLIDSGWLKVREYTPSGPKGLTVSVTRVQDELGHLQPVLVANWTIRDDGSISYLKATELHVMVMATNQHLCVRYSLKDKLAMRNPHDDMWSFSANMVVVDPGHSYRVSVFNIPKPEVGHSDYDISQNVVVPGCQDSRMLVTQFCIERGSLWQSNISLALTAKQRQTLTVSFSPDPLCDEYMVIVNCASDQHVDHAHKVNQTRLNVTFSLAKWPRYCCQFDVSIKPMFRKCGEDCTRHQRTLDICSGRHVMDSPEASSTAAGRYPRKILEYMEGFLVSKTLFTACELGVFDVLLGAGRPLSADDVSQAVGASLDGTQRLLAACCGLQLLETHQQNGRVSYSNTEETSLYLTRSGPTTLYHSIQYSSRTIYLCWHYLTDAVREGRNQYEKAFGVSSKDLFQALYRSDEEMVKFMQLMNSIWNICGRDVLTAFDLSPFKVICDLGGCSGALARQCTSAYPECAVTIFDLPKVVQTSREHFVKEADHKISFIEGDFFKDPLLEADLYILARILHDWTDERCVELLSRVHRACKPGGAVLLVEALLYEDGSGPLTAQLYSLNMLVQTEGRERTGAQYSILLAAAGFTDIQYRLTGKIYDAVLGFKENSSWSEGRFPPAGAPVPRFFIKPRLVFKDSDFRYPSSDYRPCLLLCFKCDFLDLSIAFIVALVYGSMIVEMFLF